MKQEKITRFIRTEDADRKWYLVDAQDVVLGRMATEVAKIIRGKNKAILQEISSWLSMQKKLS